MKRQARALRTDGREGACSRYPGSQGRHHDARQFASPFKKADRRNSGADFLMIERIVTPRLADIIEAIERTRDQSDFRLGLLGVRG